MPEIAEVEIVRQGLLPLRGQRLLEIEASDKFYLPEILIGQKLEEVKRHGKLLGFFFEDSIVSAHLRMTGKFLYQEEEKHRRAHFRFEKDEIFFHDSRGFGTIDLVDEWPGDLGPDLWKADTDAWQSNSKRAVKAVLLDQKVIAGIGNYLADESLYKARIHPMTLACSLFEDDWRRVLGAARDLSQEVLAKGGVSLRDYVDVDNNSGTGQVLLAVYGRGGEPCLGCSLPLEKERIAGRGSVFCKRCQIILPER